MNWYVIRTNPQSERKAAAELRRAGVRVWLPQSSRPAFRARTQVPYVKRRPLLVGYVFVRFPVMDHGLVPFGLVRGCQGVKGLVVAMSNTGEWRPFPVSDKEVAALMRRQRDREFGRPDIDNPKRRMDRLRMKYQTGMEVRVSDGPFASFFATIEKLRDDGSVDVEVSIFGRPTPVNVKSPEKSLTTLAKISEAA